MSDALKHISQADRASTLVLYKRLLTYVRPYRGRAIAALVVTLPIGALDGVIAFSMQPYLDGVVISKSMHAVLYVPLAIMAFSILKGGLTYLSIYLTGWLGLHMVQDIRRDLFTKLLTLETAYFDQTGSGNIIQYYYADPELLQKNVLSNIKDMLTKTASTLALAGTLLFISWKLAIIAIICLLGILLPLTRIRKVIKGLSDRMVKVTGDMLSFYSETAVSTRILAVYGQAGNRMRGFQQHQRGIYDQAIGLIKAQGWLTPSMQLIAAFGISIIIWYGSSLVAHKILTPGQLGSFMVALIMLYNPIKNLGDKVVQAQQSIYAAGRIFEHLDRQPTIEDEPGALALPGFSDAIVFEHVDFGYDQTTPVLQDLNLTIRKGETIALVGTSGSGKTTIASLIPRFYTVTGGSLSIDGHDLRNITLATLRQQISLVTQDDVLFSGTILENMRVGKSDATLEEIEAALEKAYLKDFINGLELGLDTPVGERGTMLSGGQRQRLAIARALLKNAPIVLFDEATSALDTESEAQVQKAMESLSEHRTVIMIAHRLSTVRHADRIIVLQQGHIVEDGSHDALIAQNGAYAHFYNLQFRTHNTPLTEAV